MRRLLLILGALGFLAAPATAEPINTLGWDDDPYFTHQRWYFSTDANPAGADEWIKPPCVGNTGPLAQIVEPGGSWMDDLGQSHQGGWHFVGPTFNTGNPAMVITIPNCAVEGMRKEIFVQEIIKTSVDVQDTDALMRAAGLAAYADGEPLTPFTLVSGPDIEVLGVDNDDPQNPAVWVRATMVYAYEPQPGFEELRLIPGLSSSSQYVVFDQIDIDTRCVPEPGTLVLLGAGGLLFGAFVWRRRRQIA